MKHKTRKLEYWLECRIFNAQKGICAMIHMTQYGPEMKGQPMEIAG